MSLECLFMALQLLVFENRWTLRTERLFRDRLNPFDIKDDVDMYNISICKVRMHVIDLLKDRLTPRTKQNHAIPASLQVFIALEFYGKGAVIDMTSQMNHSGTRPLI